MLRAARTFLSGALIFAAGWGVARAEDPDQVKQLLETRQCAACNLTGAQLGGADLRGADLTNADLAEAQLYQTNLRDADLAGARLVGANLSGADLRGAKGADLSGATTNEQTFCPDLSSGPCR
jgi:uncharacterized protein YjbI with pentapeptide repeats